METDSQHVNARRVRDQFRESSHRTDEEATIGLHDRLVRADTLCSVSNGKDKVAATVRQYFEVRAEFGFSFEYPIFINVGRQ